MGLKGTKKHESQPEIKSICNPLDIQESWYILHT